ncbi:unnamed protein product [Choristocarpus tenellus]
MMVIAESGNLHSAATNLALLFSSQVLTTSATVLLHIPTSSTSLYGLCFIRNCLFLAGTASNIFENVSFKPEETVIIVDPPRKGCDNLFLEQLFKFRPQRLVYVSCDPATQARDAKEIIAHDYTIVDIQPFDLFPQTRHIENVITFQDNNSGTSV